jgi:hypothetical protein
MLSQDEICTTILCPSGLIGSFGPRFLFAIADRFGAIAGNAHHTQCFGDCLGSFLSQR